MLPQQLCSTQTRLTNQCTGLVLVVFAMIHSLVYHSIHDDIRVDENGSPSTFSVTTAAGGSMSLPWLVLCAASSRPIMVGR
jgi:hypothetical protein